MAEIYMRNIKDWKDATIMLSLEEKGYFDEIISLIYLYDDRLPDDDELICRAIPINKKVHNRLKKSLIKRGFIQFRNGFYFNSRSTQELVKINSISVQNKVKADKRWGKSLKNNKTADATAVLKVNSESEVKELSNDSYKSTAKKETPNAKRGKRIEAEFGEDWQLPEKYLAYAIEKQFTEPEAAIEFEKFTNYWRSKAGINAVKRDWLATWRSWMLNATEWRGCNGRYPNGSSGNGGPSIMDITGQIIADRSIVDA